MALERGRGGVGPGGRGGERAPWESPAVRGLAGRLGAAAACPEEAVVPMVVEGREGTLLTAVGSDTDHTVAGEALGRVQAERGRLGRGAAWHGEGGGRPSRTLAGAGTGAGALARRRPDAPVFGCVYEYKTRSGRPVYVGDTDIRPERKFLADSRGADPETRAVAAHQGVTPEVVWAGVGQGPVGPEEMRVIRKAVREDRAQRQQVAKLGGIKPYSFHG